MIATIMSILRGLKSLFSFGKQVKEEATKRKTDNAIAENKALKVENKILRNEAANPERVKEIKEKIYKKSGNKVSINFDDIRGT